MPLWIFARWRLRSGQQVASVMGVKPLRDDQILIGKGVDKPAKGEEPFAITHVSKVFAKNCPLWTYILAEAMQQQEMVKIPVKENITITTTRLGPVGGRVFAEVFLALLFADKHSLLSLDPTRLT